MKQFNPAAADQDEFEFKPLTEGLGFHKKNQEKAPTAPKTALKFQAESMPDLAIQTPLPRKGFDSTTTLKKQVPTAIPGNTTVDEILKTLNEKRSVDFSNEKTKLREPAPIVYKSSAWDLSASLLDAMLVTAGTLLCLILLLVVTRVDLFANLYHPDGQGMVYWSLVALVATVSWIYLVGHRVFLGFTPGEWVFDQRLGKPEQFGTSDYALKAIMRSTVVLISGFILFPLISFAMNQDYLGKLMGIELVKRS
jgi:hypothetical protein